jgi:tripartite-type tricarboxylate transporter receptor subunit TctC
VPSAGQHSDHSFEIGFRAVLELRASPRKEEPMIARCAIPLAVLVVAASTVPPVISAAAQTYPSRPITIIAPYAVGGTTDLIGRIMAERMRAAFGQPVIVENVTGANGTIGVGRVARAPGDGYTLDVGQLATHVTNGALYRLPYDLVTDFEPIALVGSIPLVIAAKKAMPASDLTEFIAWLKANPNKASQGIAGVGSTTHIYGILFQKATGTRFQFIPYRGIAPAVLDLVAENIDIVISDPISALPQVQAGTIKVYAVTASHRQSIMPDIPTVDEAGLPGFHMSNWYALFAPKRTPKNIIDKLNAVVVDALGDPTVRARFAEQGVETFPREQQTPEALRSLQKAEIEKWWPIIKAANIKAE